MMCFKVFWELQRYSRRCWNAPGAGLPFQNFPPWPANNIQFSVPRAECYHAEMSDSHNIISNEVIIQKHRMFLASELRVYDHTVESGDRNALCIEISHYWLECLELLSVCMQRTQLKNLCSANLIVPAFTCDTFL